MCWSFFCLCFFVVPWLLLSSTVSLETAPETAPETEPDSCETFPPLHVCICICLPVRTEEAVVRGGPADLLRDVRQRRLCFQAYGEPGYESLIPLVRRKGRDYNCIIVPIPARGRGATAQGMPGQVYEPLWDLIIVWYEMIE